MYLNIFLKQTSPLEFLFGLDGSGARPAPHPHQVPGCSATPPCWQDAMEVQKAFSWAPFLPLKVYWQKFPPPFFCIIFLFLFLNSILCFF